MIALKGRLLLFTLAILMLFSVSWLLSKNLIGHVPVIHTVGLRLAATTGAIWLIVLFHGRHALASVSLQSRIVPFVILSFLGFSLYFLSSFSALTSINASDLIMVLAIIPAITYLLGWLSRSLSFSWLKFCGVLIVSMAALVFNFSGQEVSDFNLIGMSWALVAAFSYALYGLLSKRYLSDLPIFISLAWITLISAMTFVPVYVLDPAPLQLLSLDDVLKVLILGAVCSAPVYVLYQKLLNEGGVLYANSIGLLAPFSVAAGEWLIGLSTGFGIIKIIAMVVVMVGLLLLFMDASGVDCLHWKIRRLRLPVDGKVR